MVFKAKRADRPFDRVVVHSLSRFSRDTLHSELYVRELAKAGAQLVSITQDVGQDGSGDFIRKMLNVFDEHQSRENAKHTHRAMCENARQGFWNGSHAPFGYKVEVKERRGNKEKKVLVVDETEAPVVRKIFGMALGQEGRPVGVKAIACHLNERGVLRRGHLFSIGSVHDVLTSTTYYGVHYFNRRNARDATLATAVAVDCAPGSGDHRRRDFQCRPGAAAEPKPKKGAASRSQRANVAGRYRPLCVLRRGPHREYWQGRCVPLLLLRAQAEAGRDGLSRYAHAHGAP